MPSKPIGNVSGSALLMPSHTNNPTLLCRFLRHWNRGEYNSCARTDLTFKPAPESPLCRKREERARKAAEKERDDHKVLSAGDECCGIYDDDLLISRNRRRKRPLNRQNKRVMAQVRATPILILARWEAGIRPETLTPLPCVS